MLPQNNPASNLSPPGSNPYLFLPTVPGTDMNVIPDREVPIIPKATIHHLLFRLPIKKDSLSEWREV